MSHIYKRNPLSLCTQTIHSKTRRWRSANELIFGVSDDWPCLLLTWTNTMTSTFYFNLDSERDGMRREGDSLMIMTSIFMILKKNKRQRKIFKFHSNPKRIIKYTNRHSCMQLIIDYLLKQKRTDALGCGKWYVSETFNCLFLPPTHTHICFRLHFVHENLMLEIMKA